MMTIVSRTLSAPLLLLQFAGCPVPAAAQPATIEAAAAHGRYLVECRDREGRLRWRERIDNIVTTVGKNLALDTYLAGSAYTVTGPYMGLISGTSYTGVSASDTMTSHGGWLEAGNSNGPTYSAPRKTAVWSAASAGSKSLSAALGFGMTSGGTVEGVFLVYGSGAVTTIDNTGGVLYSAGVFSGGARTVNSGDTLSVTYAASL